MANHDDAPSSEASEETPPDLKEISVRCRALLHELSTSGNASNALAGTELMASFNIWAANMGVFRQGQQSLASRLRSAPDIRELVHQLLVALERDLEKRLIDTAEQEDTSPETKSDQSSDRSSISSYRLPCPTEDYEAASKTQLDAWTSTQNTIISLRQLALTIHRAGANHRQARIERFIGLDGNKEVCETVQRYAQQKVDHLFPNASETLRKRVAKSIAIRRGRFLYLRKHQKKLSALSEPAPALQQNEAREDEEPQLPSLIEKRQAGESVSPRARYLDADVDPSVLSNTIVTKLDPERIKIIQNNRAESVTSVKISSDFPKKPKLDPTHHHEEEIPDMFHPTLVKHNVIYDQHPLQSCPFCGGFPEELEKQYPEPGCDKGLEALEKHVRDHLISVALILAPVEMNELEKECDETKSEAERDDNSVLDPNSVGFSPVIQCSNAACDCRDRHKNSLTSWSTFEAAFEPWVNALGDKLPTNHDDPSRERNTNSQGEWEFWYPLSLPPDCQTLGPVAYPDLAEDQKLMEYFKINPQPFHQDVAKPVTSQKPVIPEEPMVPEEPIILEKPVIFDKPIASTKPRNMSLHTRLSHCLVQCPLEEPQDFLPLSDLDDIITHDNVRSQLSWATRLLSPRLPEKILSQAKKVLAILALMNETGAMKDLINEDICDEDLPLCRNGDKGDSEFDILVSPGGGKRFISFSSWPKKTRVAEFLEKQWVVQAPILDGTGQHIVLNWKCPLPLIECIRMAQGGSGVVSKAKFHPAHQHIFQPGENSYIAIKELRDKKIFENERKNLEIIRDVRHRHLITCFAMCEKESIYYLIFPWAAGGNLRDFWKSENSRPRAPNLVLWAIQQMLGLADAIKVLHHRNIRHCNIKPQSVLHFTESSRGDEGLLVLADFCAANAQETTTEYTITYDAPESEADRREGRPRFRAFDSWCLGCMFLEFTAWLTYDFMAVRSFRRRRTANDEQTSAPGSFFTKSSEGPKIHLTVVEAMQHLREHPSSGPNTALGDLVTLIEERLLQIEPGDRAKADEICSRLGEIVDYAREIPGYLGQQVDPPPVIPDFFKSYRSYE
ncbi:serine threonine kinase [Fusarium albosuccineum]|uniref:Serine threonine kinase n=1 Tax=Fusarium albosuccineum TaxID=1237068 RepID=A0A8H4L5D2_9HYPO|nr:serine threonine kinase [Fusarium albosuccineum]